MKRVLFAALVSVALATTQGCACGGTNPTNDGGSGGGATGGGTTGGGTGGGTTGGGMGGGTTGGGSGGGGGTGGGGVTGGGTGGAVGQSGPAKDVISGAGRMTGGNFVMDAQIGQGVPQAPASSSNRVLQGNSAIKP